MTLDRLGNHASFLSGFAFKSKFFNADGVGLPVIRIRDVVRGRSETFYSGEYDDRYVVSEGDYLIGMDGEFNLARWRSGSALLNQRVCKIDSISEKVDRDYLGRFLPVALKDIEDATPFVTVKHLSVKTLNEIEIPLPPLAEQKRIAGILDAAVALRAKRRGSLAQLDTLLQSTFLDMFGDPVGDGYPMVTVEDAVHSAKGSIRTGPFGSQLLHSEFVDHGIRVLGIDNAVKNTFQKGEPRFITPKKYEQLRRYTVKPDDVLITIMGTCGRCAIVPTDVGVAINTKHLCCITLDDAKCLPAFLKSYFLQHPIARDYLEKNAKGAIMSGLNMGIIKALPLPLPPLPLQSRYAGIVDAIDQQKTFHRTHLAELDTLFASLQSRAFRGEL